MEFILKSAHEGVTLGCSLSTKYFRAVRFAEWHIKVDVKFLWPERVDLGKLLAGVHAKLAVTVFQINLNKPSDF